MRRYIIGLLGGLVVIFALFQLIAATATYPEVAYLPLYTFSTISRITLTLVISVLWGVSFGILAATNRLASIVLVPFIDLLQSIPILGYFPVVIAFLFAWGSFGIELSVIVLLFTSMAWAIFFGVVGAVRTIPTNVLESAQSFGLKGWRYIRHIVLPAVMPATVTGANLAWCDGWFFIIAAEYIQYKGNVVQPPSGGLGYLLAKVSYEYKDVNLSFILLGFITFIVIYFNYVFWSRLMERAGTGTFKPIVKIDLSGVGLLGVSRARERLSFGGRLHWPRALIAASQRLRRYARVERAMATVLLVGVVTLTLYLLFGHFPSYGVIQQGFSSPPADELGVLPLLVLMTMGRLTIAYAVSLVVAIGLGVLAAEHRKIAAVVYPIYNIGQGVPILALFPVLFLTLSQFLSGGLALEITCITMLILDMIWYMFLNIVSAVKNIPTEIKEASQLFGFKGLNRVTHIVIPSILPSIVTGSILSWGTGWNTIIFAEYMPSTDPAVPPLSVPGLGSLIDKAGYEFGNTILLIFLLGVVAAIVLSMEAFVWRRLLRRFERFHVEV